MQNSCVSKSSCKQTISVKNSHRSQLPSPHPLQLSMNQWWALTGVEVFGFWQFDGGSSLFLQLDDGLTSLPNDRPRRIAGNQNLQEVLAFLCSGEQETGSQARLRQLTFSSRVFHLFLCLLRWKSISSISFIHVRIVFWSECQVGSVGQSSQTEQSHANAASLRKNWTVLRPQIPPPKPTPPEQSIQA